MTLRCLHDLEWVSNLAVLESSVNPNVLNAMSDLGLTTHRVLQRHGVEQTVSNLFQGVSRLNAYESLYIGGDLAGIREVCLSIGDTPWMLARTACTVGVFNNIRKLKRPLGLYLDENQYQRTQIKYSKVSKVMFKGVIYRSVGLRRSVWRATLLPNIVLLEVFLSELVIE